MNTAIATPTTALIVPKGDELEVSASTAQEMAAAQVHLIQWVQRKIALARQDAEELAESFANAIKHKWQVSVLQRQKRIAEKRLTFYEKIQSALEAGYVIVPSFPVEVFAIRTRRQSPKAGFTESHWDRHEQHAQGLPIGEGEHKSPWPLVRQQDITPAGEKNKKVNYWADEFEAVDFPFSMAKPRIMDATAHAMGLKIFDDFGVLPRTRRTADPIIVARIHDTNSPAWNRRTLTFIIAWHLDTETI